MDQLTQTSVRTVATRLGPLRVETAGSGLPAVLWHSLFVDSTTWDRVRAPLAAERRLVIIDGPNHGGSPPVRQPFTLDGCAAAAADVLDHLGIAGPVDWLGNAWGGHVGIVFAAAHPDRCRSLIALGAPVQPLGDADRRRIRLLRGVYRIAGPGPVISPLIDALLGPKARAGDPGAAAIVAGAFRRARRRGMFDAIGWVSLRRPDLTPELGRLPMPTLLTTNPDDPEWDTAAAGAAAARLRDGALVVLPGSGRVGPLLQAAAAVASLVTAFWRDPHATIAQYRIEAGRAAAGEHQRPGAET
jgi:pimeloyl-ACP methyl ester carboxylesterase